MDNQSRETAGYNGLMGGRVSIIGDVHCNRVKGYSREYTIGHIASTRNKHRNTQCAYVKIFIIEVFLIVL
jgi:hypothetical protein